MTELEMMQKELSELIAKRDQIKAENTVVCDMPVITNRGFKYKTGFTAGELLNAINSN